MKNNVLFYLYSTYWHLSTQLAEFEIMPIGELKDRAHAIANTLENARFRTLLHGEAKLTNFCFSRKDKVAAVDFQYVGRGVGVKDVMYFLGSSLNDKQLWQKHDDYFDNYFAILQNVLQHESQIDKQGLEASDSWLAELEQEWRSLIPFAWADFNRFIQGWSPEHVKINDYMHAQTESVLSNK